MSVQPPGVPPSWDTDKIRTQLREWRKRLLDISQSNPLLGLNRSRVSKLQVRNPGAAELFSKLVLKEAKLRMPFARREHTGHGHKLLFEGELGEEGWLIETGDVEFDVAPQDLMRRLRRIHDNARTAVQERGVTTLFLTFGLLRWKDERMGELASPLWMVPCEFIDQGPAAALRLSMADDEMQLNPALEVYLAEQHKVTLPPVEEEADSESLQGFLKSVARKVREQKWEVTEEAWLSTFSFESLVLHQDLKNMEEIAVQNSLIAALANARPWNEAREQVQNELDDLPMPQAAPVPALDADSSQLQAMMLATAGRHVVIHGPPGTGKSQTISNVIAAALERGQKVLFVSAKMAALNVVYDRLNKLSLGHFCLEAHSTKAGKARIIDDLRRTLEREPITQDNRLEAQIELLKQVRIRLNEYVRALHKRFEPLELTVYEAIGKAAKLRSEPDILCPLPWADPLNVSNPDLQQALNLLDDFTVLANVFDRRSEHPWAGIEPAPGNPLQALTLQAWLTSLATGLEVTAQSLSGLHPFFPCGHAPSFQQVGQVVPALRALAQVDRLPDNWWQTPMERLKEESGFFAKAATMAKEFLAKESERCQCFDVGWCEAATLLEPIKRTFASWYRRITPSYWTWRSTIRAKLKPNAKSDFPSLLRYQRLASELCDLDAWFQQNRERMCASVTNEGLHDPDALARVALQFRAAALLRQALATIGISPKEGCAAVSAEVHMAIENLLSKLPPQSSELADSVAKVDSLWPKGFVNGASASTAPSGAVSAQARKLLTNIHLLQEWLQLTRILKRCSDQGLSGFIERFGDISAKRARAVFEKCFYNAWASAAIASSQALGDFIGAGRMELIQKFRAVDKKTQELQLAHIRTVASAGAQKVRSANGDLGEIGEVGILQRELQKKKRIRPLRRLFADIPNVLQALKPCMLMSPISVSTFLKPGSCKFDLVIFDEASQLPTPEAIPSILRAGTVIVAGDSNQLPPTSFFETSIFDDADEFKEEQDSVQPPLDSLLDECQAIIPVFQESHLKWHYRSRDERLIKFSNHYFYDNGLITFPSALPCAPDRGVQLEYTAAGTWDRGKSRTNRVEALRVTQLVVRHYQEFPVRSLGVVAMNRSQTELIEDLLAEERRANPEIDALIGCDSAEPFFIKSLENVQGDERDTMIISVGYGKDSQGHLTLNFGPLNTEGGWCRLNVLVTRAKWQTILVTSMRAAELDGINPNNRGAMALKNFIDYAEHSCELPPPPPALTFAETNDFEDAVRGALIERGLSVDAQVGASKFRIDLAIRHRQDPSRYALGVECDGAGYHSSRTARDRDLLREQVLRQMKWRIHRVWSTEWFHNPEAAVSSILQSLEQAEAVPPEQLVEAPPLPRTVDPEGRDGVPPTADQQHVRTASTPVGKYPAGRPYQKFKGGGVLDIDVLIKPTNVRNLAHLISLIVQCEGPVHQSLVVERLKEMFGLHSIHKESSTTKNIEVAISLAYAAGQVRRPRRNGFLFTCAADVTGYRTPGDGVERSIDMIAPEELEFAVLHLVEEQFGAQREKIPPTVARLLGVNRLNSEGSTLISQVVDGLVERGALRVSGPQVYLGDSTIPKT